jgi:hypothetical protein
MQSREEESEIGNLRFESGKDKAKAASLGGREGGVA